MQGDSAPLLQLAGIAAVPVLATGYALWFRGKRSPLRATGSIALVLLLWLVSVPAFMMMCGAGRSNPAYQTLVPLLSAVLIAGLVGSNLARRVGVGVVWLAYMGMAAAYTQAVYGSRWVGTAAPRGVDASTIVEEWHSPITHMYRLSKRVTVGCREPIGASPHDPPG